MNIISIYDILYKVDTTGDSMEYRAVIKKSGDWWIGWLVDLPGVNAQEKSRKKVVESLRIGAEDITVFTERVNEPLISYDEMVKKLKKKRN